MFIVHQRGNQIHAGNLSLLFLREIIIEAVLLIKLMVRLHQPLHLKNQVAENLQPADAVEVFRLIKMVLSRIHQPFDKPVCLRIRISRISCNPCEEIAAHLRPGFHDGPEVLFPLQISVHQIAHRLAHRHRAVAVAELPVVVQLKEAPHGMVPDRKRIYHRVGIVDVLPEERIKSVFVYTGAVHSAMEASEASAFKRKLPQVNQLAASRQPFHKAPDHRGQRLVFQRRIIIRNQGHAERPPVFCLLHIRSGDPRKWRPLLHRRRLAEAMPDVPEHIAEELPCFFLPFLRKKILHIRG